MGKYEKIAEFHGKYGTAEIKQEQPTVIDSLTLYLTYSGNYAVKSPSGGTTFHDNLSTAVDRAQKSSGQK